MMPTMDKQQEFVLRTLEERDIRFIRLWFTDVLGFLKSVAVAPAELEGAFAEGIGFDGSAIEGFTRVHESDMLAKPDPSTFQILPWRAESPGTARMFCDILMPDGSPSWADPRQVLKRALDKAARMGFSFYTHPEIEFFLLTERPEMGGAMTPTPIDQGGYFDHTPHNIGHDFRREAITMLERMGISVEFSHHEVAPGQQEIDLRYADALTTADNIMTFRLVVKEVALEQGVYATFMPKPFSDEPGSAMHTHLSLFEGDQQRLPRPGRPVPPVQDGQVVHRRAAGPRRRDHRGHQPVGQLLQAAGRRRRGPVVHLLGPQQPLGAGPRADVQAAEGQRHPGRGALARQRLQPVPRLRRAAGRRPQGHRGGVRAAAGCRGRRLGADRRRAPRDGHRRAAQLLAEAISVMERSELVAETLGEHVFDFFLRNKRQEWEEYRRQVTPFELERYLPVL